MNLKAKVPPPIIVVVYLILAWGLFRALPEYNITLPFSSVFVFILLSFGLFLATHSLWRFRINRTTYSPIHLEKSKALIISGCYRFTRNPMYLGMLLMLTAAVCFFSNLAAIIILPGFVFSMNQLQIKPEEEALTRTFGDDYREYKNQVRRWI